MNKTNLKLLEALIVIGAHNVQAGIVFDANIGGAAGRARGLTYSAITVRKNFSLFQGIGEIALGAGSDKFDMQLCVRAGSGNAHTGAIGLSAKYSFKQCFFKGFIGGLYGAQRKTKTSMLLRHSW